MKIIWAGKWISVTALALQMCSPNGLAAAHDPAEPNALTLPEAIRLALANNPEAQAANARVEAAAGRAEQARKWTNPELELSAEDWPVSNGRGFSDAKQTIGVTQVLPYPGKKSWDRKMGGAGLKLSEAELAVRRTEIVRDAKAAFYRVLASQQLVAAARELVRVGEASAAAAQKRVDAGATAYQEQLRAEVQVEQAQTDLGDFERELASARQALATVLGRPQSQVAVLSGTLADKAEGALIQDAGGVWLDQHPSTAAARASVQRAEAADRRARLEPYPDVKVGVAGGRIGESDQSIIEVGFSLPIPIVDRGKGKQREALAELKVAKAELEAVKHQLQREWAQAQRRYRTAAEQVERYRERILPRADEALKLVQIGFQEGKFGFMDLVDTQRTTAESRLSYEQKVLELNVALAELEALARPEKIEASTER